MPDRGPGAHGRPSASPQATVEVTGTVQASFNGSGQYVSALNPGRPRAAYYTSTWSRSTASGASTIRPTTGCCLVGDFPLFYKAQDLYFFDPQDQVLVPDSVFVPLGATVSQLLTDLVDSLTAGPKTPWLDDATDTELRPCRTRVQQVTQRRFDRHGEPRCPQVGQAQPEELELFAAQLVWTLTGSPTSPSGFGRRAGAQRPAVDAAYPALPGRPGPGPGADAGRLRVF